MLFLTPSCSEDNNEWKSPGEGSEITGTEAQNKSIDKEVFSLINLDYPGLEKVEDYYETGEYYLAAESLLNYYRLRKDVVNPLVSLLNVSISESEKKIADDALQYKFYVKNYTDENGESYQFKKGDNNKIDWSYQPNTDGEFRSQLYRLAWFPSQAKAYKATKNEDYVKSWIEVYGDFWQQNPIPETNEYDHYGTYGALPVAERVSDAANVFFYFINSSNFTSSWLSTFLISIAKQVDYIKSHYYDAGNNIYVEQAYSVTAAALLFPEFKNAEEWLNNGSSILSKEVKNQFLEDGMQFEVDLSYHVGVVSTFYNAMLLAQANNKRDKLPADYVESMRKATEVLMNLTYPNYTVPAFNDTRPVSWTKNVITKNLKKYVEMFPENENMKWMAYSGSQGKEPEYLTKAFTSSGYYVLRNGWSKESTMMIHTNNPTAAWHNQGDNGTFELYHNGRNFFPDSGCFTYTNGSTREWYRSAKQHNTMTLGDAHISDSRRNGKF
jgi:Heparinase II/III-like protein.